MRPRRFRPHAPNAVTLALTLALSLYMQNSSNAAGPPPQPDAARIALALRKLGVVGSVLYVAAHPDDENTNLIAYLSNGRMVRTAYLSVTRGDGGQNLIGSEQGPALGLIRTQELLAARRVDGGEQFFTRARDFGFSKSPEETLRIWGREPVLADMVAVIRRFRPDVIVTRFSPEPSETHGHHTASAMLAVEAFHAAADPKFHPEQLTGGVTAWQARRLYWNRSSFFVKPGDDLSGFASLDVDGYSPLLGASFGEIAADSRSMHKSQGFGVARTRTPIVEYFKLLAEAGAPAAAPKKGAPFDLLDGIDTSWKRMPGGVHVGALVQRAVHAFDPAAPYAVVPTLLEIDRALDGVGDARWREQKRREVADLLVACTGLYAEATADDYRVVPGGGFELTTNLHNRSPVKMTLEEENLPFKGVHGVHHPLESTAVDHRVWSIPTTVPLSTPYWLEAPPDPGLYRVLDPRLIGAPEQEPPVNVEFVLGFPGGRRLTLTRPVTFKWTDPVMGERFRPLEVTPVVSVRPASGVLLFPGDAAKTLDVDLVAGLNKVSGDARVEAPQGWTVEPASVPFALATKGSEGRVTFHVRPAPGATAGVLRVVATVEGQENRRGVVRIEHAHIPIQTMLVDADVRVVPLALATGGRRIGYIPGPGDEVPAALRGVGYDVTILGDAALGAGPAALAPFDAVVVGVRAFNTSERLRAAHAALMAYVEGGGTLVVQYNTNNRLAPLSVPIGPWPFEIGQRRVSDETAAVVVPPHGHPALTTPNRVDARDFDGWVQERGLYFAETWDKRYETPLVMHDPGEPPQAGSLLWARYGKGTFVYTGLAFFRQLPAGVPGAFRLFANLLAGSGGAAHGR